MNLALSQLRHAVQVWCIASDAHWLNTCNAAQLLTTDEQQHAARFRHAEAHRHFVVGRSSLRLLLASYLNIPPAEVLLHTNDHGRPQLASGQLAFNVSHSGGTILLTFTACGPLGVDVEHHRERLSGPDVSTRVFSPSELEILQQASPATRTQTFFDLWCAKEAAAKADGRGLSADPRTYTLDAPEYLATGRSAVHHLPLALHVQRLHLCTGISAAVALAPSIHHVQCADLSLQALQSLLDFQPSPSYA